MNALRAPIVDFDPAPLSEAGEESALDPVFARAVDTFIRLNVAINAKDKPYEALMHVSKSLRDFGVTHEVAEEFVAAIEEQAIGLGVDFTQKAKPTPMEMAIYVMDKKPELSDDKDHFIVSWDGVKKFGGKYDTDTVAELHINGTRSTKSNVPKFEEMFAGNGKRYLTVHLQKLKENGGEELDQQGMDQVTLIQAVGPVAAASAGGMAMKQSIEAGTVSPAVMEVVQSVAAINNAVTSAKFEGAPSQAAPKIVEVKRDIPAQVTQAAQVVQTIPAVVVKAVNRAMDVAMPNLPKAEPVKISANTLSRPENAAPVMAKNDNVVAPAVQKPAVQQPVIQQPVAQAPVQQAAAPVQAAPVNKAPVQSAPVFAAPVINTVAPTAPVYSAPVQAAPVVAAPVINTVTPAAPVYSAPVQAAPVVAAPVINTVAPAAPVYKAPVQTAPVINTVAPTAPVQKAPDVVKPAQQALAQPQTQPDNTPKKVVEVIKEVITAAAPIPALVDVSNISARKVEQVTVTEVRTTTASGAPSIVKQILTTIVPGMAQPMQVKPALATEEKKAGQLTDKEKAKLEEAKIREELEERHSKKDNRERSFRPEVEVYKVTPYDIQRVEWSRPEPVKFHESERVEKNNFWTNGEKKKDENFLFGGGGSIGGGSVKETFKSACAGCSGGRGCCGSSSKPSDAPIFRR